MKSVFVTASDAWVLYFASTLVIGVCQVSIFAPAFGLGGAHLAAIALELVALTVVAFFLVKRLFAGLSERKSLLIGVEWLALTVAARFGLGHFLFGGGWNSLLAEYDIRNGCYGLAILLWQLIVPLLAFRLAQSRNKAS